MACRRSLSSRRGAAPGRARGSRPASRAGQPPFAPRPRCLSRPGGPSRLSVGGSHAGGGTAAARRAPTRRNSWSTTSGVPADGRRAVESLRDGADPQRRRAARRPRQVSGDPAAARVGRGDDGRDPHAGLPDRLRGRAPLDRARGPARLPLPAEPVLRRAPRDPAAPRPVRRHRRRGRRGPHPAPLLPAQLGAAFAGQRGVHGRLLPRLACARGGRAVARRGAARRALCRPERQRAAPVRHPPGGAPHLTPATRARAGLRRPRCGPGP
jgi:hypothetical protein